MHTLGILNMHYFCSDSSSLKFLPIHTDTAAQSVKRKILVGFM